MTEKQQHKEMPLCCQFTFLTCFQSISQYCTAHTSSFILQFIQITLYQREKNALQSKYRNPPNTFNIILQEQCVLFSALFFFKHSRTHEGHLWMFTKTF